MLNIKNTGNNEIFLIVTFMDNMAIYQEMAELLQTAHDVVFANQSLTRFVFKGMLFSCPNPIALTDSGFFDKEQLVFAKIKNFRKSKQKLKKHLKGILGCEIAWIGRFADVKSNWPNLAACNWTEVNDKLRARMQSLRNS